MKIGRILLLAIMVVASSATPTVKSNEICSACPEARETYEVPLVPVTTFPFESIYQYPLEVNRIKENGTHVFLPANQKLFSKFYINLSSEKEKFFGISEQAFGGLSTPNRQYEMI